MVVALGQHGGHRADGRVRGRRGGAGLALVERKQTEEAAVLFNAVAQAARANDVAKAKDATRRLTDKFAGTGYAPRAAFVLAKLQFDAGDSAAARAQLQWIVDHADEQELQEIARYRLAELMLNDKQYDDALKMLDAKVGEPLRGSMPTCAVTPTPPVDARTTRAPPTRPHWQSSTRSRPIATMYK